VFILILRFRQRHGLSQTPGQVMRILSATILEKAAINVVFCEIKEQIGDTHCHNQLELF
jgi:hypothetical protein